MRVRVCPFGHVHCCQRVSGYHRGRRRVAMPANVKADRSVWHARPTPRAAPLELLLLDALPLHWQFMFIELMLICARRHDFLMECNFTLGRGVRISDFAERRNDPMFVRSTGCVSECLNVCVSEWTTGVHSIAF